MGMGPLTFEIILTFFVTAAVLYRYGNWYRHHILVTVAVLIAWYFSMLIVFVLPLDVSNTIYETCLHDAQVSAQAAAAISETPAPLMVTSSPPHSRPSRALPRTPLDNTISNLINTNNINNNNFNKDFPEYDASFNSRYSDGKVKKNIHPVKSRGYADNAGGNNLKHQETNNDDRESTESRKARSDPNKQNPPLEMQGTGLDLQHKPPSMLELKQQQQQVTEPPQPPPGYDDTAVLGAAVKQIMSTINSTVPVSAATQRPAPGTFPGLGNKQTDAAAGGSGGVLGVNNKSDHTLSNKVNFDNMGTPRNSNKTTPSIDMRPGGVGAGGSVDHDNHSSETDRAALAGKPRNGLADPDNNALKLQSTGITSDVGVGSIVDGGIGASDNETVDVAASAAVNGTGVEELSRPVFRCKEPWSRVKAGVFPAFWRVIYWTSQVLTWLVLPLMQSYTKAGEFTVWGKMRSALIDNAIYYGSYLLIVGILLLYIALRPDVFLDGSQLRAIAASASNTWGLFWLVLLLGYGLVEVPRWLWNAACPQFMLNQGYFNSAKLAHERAEAWDHLNDLLQSVQSVGSSIGNNHPLRSHLDTVESRVPAELLDRMRRVSQHDGPHADVPSEKALVRLHKQLLKSLQHHNRVETQWVLMVEKVIYLEDAQRNSCSHDSHFKHSTPRDRSNLVAMLYTPTLEWLWVCRARGYLLRCLAVASAVVSAAVVWSELTFFNQHPTLSIFAIIVNIAKSNYDYITIEVISSLTMAYIALCAYSTLFSVRVLNLYYLAPHHQTDQYSLIFSGMMLCRLTPPMCLNFLSLIHMDSHVISIHTQETHYTQIMGHMDVISIISDGFNVYFPMMIVALCLATYYSLGSRLLSALGFQQFIGTDSLTSDLIDEGRTLINRECRKRQRQQESAARRREFSQRFGVGGSTTSLYRSARQRAEELLSRPYRRDPANEASQMELLTSTTSSPHYTAPDSPHHTLPDSPQHSTTQYTTSSHYTSDPANYTGDNTHYSTPHSAHYNTHYSTNGQYRSTGGGGAASTYLDDPDMASDSRMDDLLDGSPTTGFGRDGARYSRTRPNRPDKGLFDDV